MNADIHTVMQPDVVIDKRRGAVPYAIYDLDHTLVAPREGRTFSKDKADWQWLSDGVPLKLQEIAKTHDIVIVTNQTRTWRIELVHDVIAEAKLPISALIAFSKAARKPSPEGFLAAFGSPPAGSFVVGDASGEGAWSDSDRKFADALSVKFATPGEHFRADVARREYKLAITPHDAPEVLVLVGYPASGKTTQAQLLVAATANSANPYIHISGDAMKSDTKRMVRAAEKALQEHDAASIIFDATNGTEKKRAAFALFAQARNLPVRTIVLDAPQGGVPDIDRALKRQQVREASGGTRVPRIAFATYKKRYEAPQDAEFVML